MNATRVSRPLVGILGLTLLIGAVAYIAHHHPNQVSPNVAAASTAAATPTSPPATKPSGGAEVALAPAVTNYRTAGYGVALAPATIDKPATQPTLSAVGFDSAPPAGPAISASAALSQGKSKLDAGQLLEGRKILNDALNNGGLSQADTAAIKAMIVKANETILFSPNHFSDDPYGGAFTVPSGGVMARIAKTYCVTPELLCRINALTDARKLRAGQSIKVVQGPFHAVVSKSAFTIDLYLGGVPGEKSAMYVASYGVGLGKDDSTPSGTWIVEPGRKLSNPKYYSPRGQGTIEAGDPKNPLGKYWIGLAGTEGQSVGKVSYGIHGTIEPDSIGKMSSMGCIRMHNEDVELVYEMLVEGKSTVIVKD